MTDSDTTAKMFLSATADPNVQDMDGAKPLNMADLRVMWKHPELCWETGIKRRTTAWI